MLILDLILVVAVTILIFVLIQLYVGYAISGKVRKAMDDVEEIKQGMISLNSELEFDDALYELYRKYGFYVDSLKLSELKGEKGVFTWRIQATQQDEVKD